MSEGTTSSRALLALALLLSLLAVVWAAGPQAAPAQKASKVVEHVGKLKGTRFFIAFAVRNGDAVEAYLCDGRGAAERFHGRLDGTRVRLTSEDGDTPLSASLKAGTFAGSVRLAGADRRFTAPRARGASGLYVLQVASSAESATAVSARGVRIVTRMRGTSAVHRVTVPGRPSRRLKTTGRPEAPPSGDQLRVVVRQLPGGRLVGRGTVTPKAKPIGSGTGTQWCCPYWEF